MTVTWNMMGKKPTLEDLVDIFHPSDVHHDLLVIGSQESCAPIAKSMFVPSK